MVATANRLSTPEDFDPGPLQQRGVPQSPQALQPRDPQHHVYENTQNRLPACPAASDGPSDSIKRRDLIADGSAFVLSGVLSARECAYYMRAAEEIGYRDCGYKPNIRVNDRVVAISEEVADIMYRRIQPFLAPTVDLTTGRHTDTQGVPKGRYAACRWVPSGLNECFRICRYDPGGHFRPHYDNGFDRSSDERSIQTFMLYLNDGFRGGDTHFFVGTGQQPYAPPDPSKVTHSYTPQAGDALVFFSGLLHDGGGLTSGQKVIMRSEVMYTPQSEERLQMQVLADYFSDLGEELAVAGETDTLEALREGQLTQLLVLRSKLAVVQGWLAEQGGRQASLQELVVVLEDDSTDVTEQFSTGLQGVGGLLQLQGRALNS